MVPFFGILTMSTYPPRETGSHIIPTYLEKREQDHTPCRDTCKEEITYLPTHPERQDHASYRHIWEEEHQHLKRVVTSDLRNCVFAVINRKLTPSRKSRKLPKLPPEAEKMFKAPLFSKFQMIFYFSSKKINQFFQVLVQKVHFLRDKLLC